MSDMTCIVFYGCINKLGSIEHSREKTIIRDRIPYARRRARERAREHSKLSRISAAEVFTVVNGEYINPELWINGYQQD